MYMTFLRYTQMEIIKKLGGRFKSVASFVLDQDPSYLADLYSDLPGQPDEQVKSEPEEDLAISTIPTSPEKALKRLLDNGWENRTGTPVEAEYSTGLVNEYETTETSVSFDGTGFPTESLYLYPYILAHLESNPSAHAFHYRSARWGRDGIKTEDGRRNFPAQSAVVYAPGLTLPEYQALRLIHAMASRSLELNVVGSLVQTQAIGSDTKYFGLVVRPWQQSPSRALLRLRGEGLFLVHAVVHLKTLHTRVDEHWVALRRFDLANLLWYDDHLECASYEHAVLYNGARLLNRDAMRTPEAPYMPERGEDPEDFYESVCTEDRARLARFLWSLDIYASEDEILAVYNRIK